jgi:hypothetical protein
MMPCAVCTVDMEMMTAGFLVESQNQGRRFLGLELKTDSSGLVIWESKISRWFLDLCLKTMQSTVCRLHHKTDGRMIQCGAYVEICQLASPRSKSR